MKKVVIRKLLFHDRCLRRVVTAGLDSAFEPLCVEVPLTQEAAEAQMAERGKGKRMPAAHKRPTAAPGTATDFLATLDAPKRKRRRGRKNTSLRPPLPAAQRDPTNREGDGQHDVLAALGFDVDDISGSVADLEGFT